MPATPARDSRWSRRRYGSWQSARLAHGIIREIITESGRDNATTSPPSRDQARARGRRADGLDGDDAEESILATQKQKSAADQVAAAMVQIERGPTSSPPNRSRASRPPRGSTSSPGRSNMCSHAQPFPRRRPSRGISASTCGCASAPSLRVRGRERDRGRGVGTVAPLPGAERFVGVRNIRGELLPVSTCVRPRHQQRRPAQMPARRRARRRRAGFAIDEVIEVGVLPPTPRSPPRLLRRGARRRGLIGVVDVERLFTNSAVAS